MIAYLRNLEKIGIMISPGRTSCVILCLVYLIGTYRAYLKSQLDSLWAGPSQLEALTLLWRQNFEETITEVFLEAGSPDLLVFLVSDMFFSENT